MQTMLTGSLLRRSLLFFVCASALALPVHAQDGLGSLLEEAERPGSASPGAGRPDRRQPAPSAAATKQAIAEVKEIFRDDYTKATTPPAKLGLARQLLSQAGKTTASAEQWALFTEVMRLASDAGDIALTFEAIDQSGERFAVDADELKLDAMSKLVTKAPPQAFDDLGREALALARKTSQTGSPQVASKCLSLAAGLARKTKNRTLMAEVTKIQQSARDQEKELKELAAITAKLEADPGNPDVCLEAAKYFCFKVNDWERGLPLLAKGSDTELARLAVAEKNAARSQEAVLALGDSWWDWAERERGPARAAAMLHAADLYATMVQGTAGLERARLEKRMREAAAGSTGREKRVSLVDIPESSATGMQYGLTKDGTFKGEPFTCGGRAWPKALMVMSQPQGTSVVYALPKGAKRLTGVAGVITPKGAGIQPEKPLKFEILIDGVSAWQSDPLPLRDAMQPFDVQLFGAERLELRTTCESASSAWSAWLNPELVF